MRVADCIFLPNTISSTHSRSKHEHSIVLFKAANSLSIGGFVPSDPYADVGNDPVAYAAQSAGMAFPVGAPAVYSGRVRSVQYAQMVGIGLCRTQYALPGNDVSEHSRQYYAHFCAGTVSTQSDFILFRAALLQAISISMGKMVYDMMQRTVKVPEYPRRIVSLVPSQTELLYDLGLDQEVIAITKFCIHPDEWFRTKTRIGGTKKLHLERILALEPDLVIANKEENTQSEIEWLAERVPVWISDIQNLSDAYTMIRKIASLCGKETEGKKLIRDIQQRFSQLHNPASTPDTVAYFIWREPWMCAASGTFIDDMLRAGGWQNAFAELQRYPEISETQIRELQPDWIFLSSEPYPFKEKHIAELQAIAPHARILLVDGELFSWYGSRLLHSAAYFSQLQSAMKQAR